jgi:hypothetical protein
MNIQIDSSAEQFATVMMPEYTAYKDSPHSRWMRKMYIVPEQAGS